MKIDPRIETVAAATSKIMAIAAAASIPNCVNLPLCSIVQPLENRPPPAYLKKKLGHLRPRVYHANAGGCSAGRIAAHLSLQMMKSSLTISQQTVSSYQLMRYAPCHIPS